MSGSFEDVLIVIPCLNEEAHLPALLARLAAEAAGALIVVADGGSRDRSCAIVAEARAAHPNVVLLDNPRRLQSAGLNLAVRAHGAGRRWLVRIDAHCGYPADYVGGLIRAAAAHDATSVVVPMVTRGDGCFQKGVAAAQNSVLGTGGSPHRHVREGRFVDHGHHALFRIDLYCAVGGYDEGFSHNEDAELDRRLTLAGARIWLEPGQAIDYFPRRSPHALARQYFGYGGGRARTIARHRMTLKPRQAAPLAVLPAILLVAGAPWAPILALPASAWAAAALLVGLRLAVKARDACVAAAGPAAMVMHAAWSAGYWRALLLGPHPDPPPAPIGAHPAR